MSSALTGYPETGQKISTTAITITESHVVSWASLTGDWLPIHTDREYAARSRFGERIAHGPLTLAMALGLSTRSQVIDGDRTTAWLGLNDLRALAPVLIGDTIRAVVEVTEARPAKREGQFVVTLSYRVVNQREEDVMTFTSILLMSAEAP
ncbi:MaoC/PaaZ C-terminal domain-containing protein [Nonomuraea ferruginea]|uniref:MaoC/PaaZ C-terminal domain-containing protein n=1 Tax=Nonomuraea ferruginea TaxID=46174 RepID=A0ABT4T1Y8_9ACTN|nr:MaoC/PaaZ C-terminal domain-containing protein [Nonomuraea ferruginea]MDA0643516.1 MaoC/PaaZ C-terminal domain-containing protein [Nonomuraea ferruginea]